MRVRKMNNSPSILYIMPRSAGDILQSTAICKRIREKYPECILHFAVEEKFKEQILTCPWIDEVLEYHPSMDNISYITSYFDIVYAPHLYLQYLHTSNWIHKGNTSKNIIDHFAWFADVYEDKRKFFGPEEFYVPGKEVEGLDFKKNKYIVIVTNDSHQMLTKRYKFWNEIVKNLDKILPSEFQFIQCGLKEDILLENRRIIDMRGRTSILELNYIIKNSMLVLSADSYPVHVAAILRTPILGLYGSTFSQQSGPVYLNWGTPMKLLQAEFSTGCGYACYKSECKVGRKCIDNIDSKEIFEKAINLINLSTPENYIFERYESSISGYTTIFNGENAELPYIESIKSMLGFCDEVVVVDGGSTDGTKERLEKEFGDNDKVVIYEKEFDWDTPAQDGEQKAFARGICKSDFCWQQDADEIVHENDYEKIKALVRYFPEEVDIIHLPVIDYFNGDFISNDYHLWKWRLSRNKSNIWHGIPKHLQVEKDGKIFAKSGTTDGCDYIDIQTQMPLPHTGFWTREADQMRLYDVGSYVMWITKMFEALPSIHHYSWFSISRKIKHSKLFWDKCWANLYNEISTPRFTDDIKVEKEKLIKNGGCHGTNGVLIPVVKFHPKIIEEWVEKVKKEDE